MRINKFLAHCGVASRRKAEALILDGRITVNGRIIRDLAVTISDGDKVRLDESLVKIPQNFEYYILHKPKGYICTSKDELGRMNVTDLIKTNHRIYSVGRLDKDTTGLIIMTDDGDLANKMLHPRFKLERKYYAYTKEQFHAKDLEKIKKGVFIGPRERVKADIKEVGFDKGKYKWRVILREGKNREIRRIFLKYNQKVYNLHRYAFGGFTLKGIDRSKSKRISKKEIMTRLNIS
jgi:pseudouridine synthase